MFALPARQLLTIDERLICFCERAIECDLCCVADVDWLAASPAMSAGSNLTIREEDIRASILSAVEDKLRRRLREVFQQAQVVSLSN